MAQVNTVRLDIKLRFNGSEWGTVSLDVNGGESAPTDIEMVDAFDIEREFGLGGPDKVPCLSLHDHIAQKLHGMTLPPASDDTQNERVQDAIDVVLIQEHFSTAAAQRRLRRACEATFAARSAHAWPPSFDPPDAWCQPFAAMAHELELPITDLDSATKEIRRFVARVAEAE